jgi:type I restriction enzyme S subunit
LGAIDDKIENNRRINTNLELQAQALYKQWFVDNRCDDWKTKKLSEFFNVVTGKKDANFSTKDGAYPFFTCSQDVLKAPDYSFEGAAILLAGNGDFNVKRYIGKFEAYQRTYVLIPFDRKYHSFLYLTIKHYLQEITGGSRGSVIKFITKGNIADFEVALPQINIDDKLAVLDSLYQTIDRNTAENHNLATLRDTLLPKLMNGELKIGDSFVTL